MYDLQVLFQYKRIIINVNDKQTNKQTNSQTNNNDLFDTDGGETIVSIYKDLWSVIQGLVHST